MCPFCIYPNYYLNLYLAIFNFFQNQKALLLVVNCENMSKNVLNSQNDVVQADSNKNFIHHFQHFRKQHRHKDNKNKFLHNQNRPSFIKRDSEPTTSTDEQHHIFLNQSNNIYILAKYGQTVSLPCIIYRQVNQDLTNVKFFD